MTTLITGANGMVSSALLRALPSTDGVRVLVRDAAKAPKLPGLEVAVGDLHRPETLPDAFAGVETLWLLTPVAADAPHASSNAIWAARHAGVRHVVRMSAIGAAHDAPTRNGRLHILSDVELMNSGLGWTILRPHFFMQNMFGSVSDGTMYGLVGEGRLGLVDVDDIAALAAAVLKDPAAHQGKIYTPTGPESIDLHQAAAEAAEALKTPVKYQPLPHDKVYDGLREAGMPEYVARVYQEYGRAYSGNWGDYTTTDVQDVVGTPGRTFADFARANADSLRG